MCSPNPGLLQTKAHNGIDNVAHVQVLCASVRHGRSLASAPTLPIFCPPLSTDVSGWLRPNAIPTIVSRTSIYGPVDFQRARPDTRKAVVHGLLQLTRLGSYACTLIQGFFFLFLSPLIITLFLFCFFIFVFDPSSWCRIMMDGNQKVDLQATAAAWMDLQRLLQLHPRKPSHGEEAAK